ncbi:hypothetical protein HUU05_06860 [candidate division KSB1 bacterium]|nr:hypothetical protein [candidate division KSB1 bacterium]
MRSFSQMLSTTVVGLAMLVSLSFAGDKMTTHTSGKFAGPKANTGTVTHSIENGKNVLEVSADFVVPDTPDPHWQVIDSKGNVYLLSRFPIKGDAVNRKITLPTYIKDIAKVQVWCAFAEVVLGEASFDKTVSLSMK